MKTISAELKFVTLIFKTGVILARKLSGQGLGFAEIAILYAISQSPEGKIQMGELGERVGLTVDHLGKNLAPLEKIALVKREAHVRKAEAGTVEITETGKQLLEKALELAEMRCGGMIPEDQTGNTELVNKFLESIRA